MRAYPRYPVSLDARLITPDGRMIAALVTDLSAGGAGIQTNAEVPDLQTFLLVITERTLALRVECEVRSIRDLWSKRVIHARFLTADAASPIEDAIEALQAQSHGETVFSAPAAGMANVVRSLLHRRAA